MKTIKIFALPSHASMERTSGVDFARIIQPMKALDGYKDEEVEFSVHVYDPKEDTEVSWMDVAQEFDIIYLNYTSDAWAFARMGMLARKFNKKLVLDMDDALWHILPDNSAYNVYKKGAEGHKIITSICREVDAITVTNSYLKNVVIHNTGRHPSAVKVFPNTVDFDLYSYRSPFRDEYDFRILHFGSTTHFVDLQSEEFFKGIDKIMKDYPNVVFKTVGALIPKYKEAWGQRYEHGFGDPDIYKWIKDKFPTFLSEADVVVAPLSDNTYNRCKSDIKRSETATAMKPFIGQKIRQYEEVIEDGVDGFLALSAQDWYNSLKALIEDKALRKSMAQKAFERVGRERNVKGLIKEYAEFFKGLDKAQSNI